MNYYEQAAERLRKESTSVTGAKASAMKAAVRDALLQFARQDEEFAQAIVQGGSFSACMAEVARGVGQSISDLKARIKELENRPVEVAVEVDEQAIQEAVQAERERLEIERTRLISKAANDAADAERAKHVEAEKTFKAKIAELNKQIKEAGAAMAETTKQIQELTEKAKAAEKAGAESKQLRAQIKDLQGQLTLASPEVAQFKAAFDRAQAELVTMLKALRKVEDTEIKAKLSTAARTVLSNFAGQIEG